MRKIFIGMSPGFYKKNLFSELNKKMSVLVVYTTDYDKSSRNTDFMKGNMDFPYVELKGGKIQQSIQLLKIVLFEKYDELIVGGYDSLFCWVPVLFSSKKKNAAMIESTIRETKMKGWRPMMKKMFFSRLARAYVCGTPHAQLTKAFGFKGENVFWHSVGLINTVPQPPFEARQKVKKFLFVGRLIKEKNLAWLIERFSHHPELELDIIGFGSLERELKSKVVTPNIHFIGAVDNEKLSSYYRNSDVFILPSISETWGLVVEEALNNGTPVMLSHMVGCADDLVLSDQAGVVFKLNDVDDFEKKLAQMKTLSVYNEKRRFISTLDFNARRQMVINAFCK